MAVSGDHLVGRGRQQGLPYVSDGGPRPRPARQHDPRSDPMRFRGAAQDERIEAVEGADIEQID